MSDLHGLAETATRRGEAYALLARLVLEMPSPAFLRAMQASLASATLERGLPLADEIAALLRAVQAALLSADTIALCAEHTRLFGGVSPTYGPPPPYESLAREGRVPGMATAAVTAAYAAADLHPQLPDAGPADHLAVELRFIALCCAREAACWRQADTGAALAWLRRERSFLNEHVLSWAPSHCTRVAAAARDDYHRTVAQLVALACELDRSDLESLAAEVAGAATTDSPRGA